MKHRLERVNEVIRRELSEIVRREVVFSAPLVTIQSADITPDLKSCHIYVSVIGNDAQKHEVIARLLDKRKQLQHMLMKRVVLKYTPQLHFEIDHALERGDRVMQIMDEIVLPPDPEEPTETDISPEDDTPADDPQ
jgi:ribosome-binding factor A